MVSRADARSALRLRYSIPPVEHPNLFMLCVHARGTVLRPQTILGLQDPVVWLRSLSPSWLRDNRAAIVVYIVGPLKEGRICLRPRMCIIYRMLWIPYYPPSQCPHKLWHPVVYRPGVFTHGQIRKDPPKTVPELRTCQSSLQNVSQRVPIPGYIKIVHSLHSRVLCTTTVTQGQERKAVNIDSVRLTHSPTVNPTLTHSLNQVNLNPIRLDPKHTHTHPSSSPNPSIHRGSGVPSLHPAHRDSVATPSHPAQQGLADEQRKIRENAVYPTQH